MKLGNMMRYKESIERREEGKFTTVYTVCKLYHMRNSSRFIGRCWVYKSSGFLTDPIFFYDPKLFSYELNSEIEKKTFERGVSRNLLFNFYYFKAYIMILHFFAMSKLS